MHIHTQTELMFQWQQMHYGLSYVHILSICASTRACVSPWAFNMVVKCESRPIPHLPSTQISWHAAKANRHEDGAEGITMQPSMQFVLTLSGVLSSPLILMSSPGFSFTGIQRPNEALGVGWGGGSRATSIHPHKHPHTNTRNGTVHISRQTHIFWAETCQIATVETSAHQSRYRYNFWTCCKTTCAQLVSPLGWLR